MADRKDMYLESMRAIRSIVNEGNQDTLVPSCPEWTVKDVIAHQLGVFVDMATGNTESGGTPEWTAKQVARYKDLSLNELWDAWDMAISEAGDEAADVMRTTVPDLIVHEYDIRGAIGNTGNRDNAYLVEAVRNFMEFQHEAINDAGLPAVHIITAGGSAVSGNGEPGIELRASAYEAMRMLFGRRSEDQVRAMNWSADPGPWLNVLPLMPLLEQDLVE